MTKEVKDLNVVNYKTLTKQIKDDSKKWKDTPSSCLEKLIFLKWPYYPKQSRFNVIPYQMRASQVALAVKNPPANAGDVKRRRFHPWVRKIPWRRKWQPTPVILPGESHGQRSLVDYSPWGSKELDMTE